MTYFDIIFTRFLDISSFERHLFFEEHNIRFHDSLNSTTPTMEVSPKDCIGHAPGPKEESPERTIGEIRRFNGKKWIRTELQMKSDSTRDIKLHLGGAIRVHLDMINLFDQIGVEEELMEHPELFREYPIQGGREPRANLFFHEKATDGETMQPGYKYRSTRMKAISYKGFPSLEFVSKQTAKHCSVPYWNIGVNAVCYRDGNDSIGYHGDNDQGEDKILSKFGCTSSSHLRKQANNK
jgi:hypothetical protein